MFNIANYQRNENENYDEISPHTSQNGYDQKNPQTINAGEGVERREPSYTVGESVNRYSHYGEQQLVPKKLKIELPYDPAIPLLGIYPEKTIIQKDTCTPMFIAALLTIARTWKQPKCPSTEEWIKKMWYIYTRDYYSVIKRNEIESFVETWMDLETVIQSKVSQKEKKQYRILTHICGIQKNGIDDPICKAEIETQTQRTNVWIRRGKGGVG